MDLDIVYSAQKYAAVVLRAIPRSIKLRLQMNIKHEMKARQEFSDRSLEIAFKDFYTGFLTEEEIREVIGGKDLWISEDEVLERWALKGTVRTSAAA